MAVPLAGWAEADITPPIGVPLGGRGPRFTQATDVLDPLVAQVTVLQDAAGSRSVWVSLDHVGITRRLAEPLRFELASVVDAPLDAVILNYSHTHSGPMATMDGYATLTPKPEVLAAYEGERNARVLRAAVQAASAMQPVDARLCLGTSAIGINRRRRNGLGETVMGPNPEGPCNPDLWVLELTGVDSQDRCVIFSYGCHAVIVYGFCWDGISADYPGVARARLRAQLGSRTHAQFVQGLAGNVRPRVLADLEQGTFRKSTPADPEHAGAELARDVARTLANEGEKLELDIAASATTFRVAKDLERNPPAESWASVAREPGESKANLGRYWLERLESGIPPVRSVPWDVGLLRLTERHAVAWLAGEPMAEWMPLIRRWVGSGQVAVWGYCQNASGYLPTDALLAEGGYEVTHSNLHYAIGPGPFREGVDAAAGGAIRALSSRVGYSG